MSERTIRSGELVVQDPSDAAVYLLSWEELADGVTLSGAGTLTVSVVAPAEDSVTLVADQLALVSGNRSARIRLAGGRRGTRYNVAHRITTSESPAQTLERSFDVLVQDL